MASSYDISANGTHVTVNVKDDVGSAIVSQIEIDDFPSSANPVSVEDGDAGSLEMDVNGDSYRKAALRPITLSLTLIPRSDGDVKLNNACLKNFGLEHNRFDLLVHYAPGLGDTFEEAVFKNGILHSVQKGYTFVGAGRIDVRRYVFQFPPPGFQGN